MATVLLIVIFISYISLGIPDSLFGAAWPAIYSEFSLPVSYANLITVIHCIGTISSSLLSARIIKRLGTAKVTLLSTLLTSLALLGFSLSDSFLKVSYRFDLFCKRLDVGIAFYDHLVVHTCVFSVTDSFKQY